MIEQKSTSYEWILQCIPDGLLGGDFCKIVLSTLTIKKHIAQIGTKLNPKYEWISTDNKAAIEDARQAVVMEDEVKTPEDVKAYYEEYGFDKLVAAVSKWINHDGIVEREYNIDRLWIGRYIDFLDKATEYMVWFKSDQAIAKRRLSELKKHHKKQGNE